MYSIHDIPMLYNILYYTTPNFHSYINFEIPTLTLFWVIIIRFIFLFVTQTMLLISHYL